MTNGDRIRAMSNEELVKMLGGNCYFCKYYTGFEDCTGVTCAEGVKAYLESEVE